MSRAERLGPGVALLILCGGYGCGDPGGGSGAPGVEAPGGQEARHTPAQTPPFEPLLPGGPGPLAPRDGLPGLRAVSACTFEDGTTGRLEVVYQFPDRVRWTTRFTQGDVSRLQREYRYGDRVFRLGPGENLSVECPPGQRDAVWRGQALRRATLLWPLTFEWEPTAAGTLLAAIPGPAGADDPALGELEASLDGEGRAERVVVYDPDGSPQEVLLVEAWGESDGREVPTQLRLLVWSGGTETPVWSEVIEQFDTSIRFVDSVFVPRDQRPREGTTAPTVEEITVPPATRRFITAPGLAQAGWSDRLVIAREAMAALRPPPGERLDDAAILQVDGTGQPLGLIVRLADAPDPAPAGWERTEATGALSLRLPRAEALDATWVQVLLNRAGPRAGSPYARLLPREDGSLALQVVVPLAP